MAEKKVVIRIEAVKDTSVDVASTAVAQGFQTVGQYLAQLTAAINRFGAEHAQTFGRASQNTDMWRQQILGATTALVTSTQTGSAAMVELLSRVERELKNVALGISDVDINTRLMLRGMQDAGAAAAVAGTKTDKFGGTLRMLKNLAGQAGLALGGAGLGGTLAALAHQVVTIGSDFEQMRVRMESATKSAILGDNLMAFSRQFSTSAPFDLKSVSEATLSLEKFHASSVKLLPAVGDAAAAMGERVQDVGFFIGKSWQGVAEAADVVRDRLAITNAMLKQAGAEVSNSGQLMLHTTEQIEKYRKALISVLGSEFTGSMARQTQTLSGQISMLKDQTILAAAGIGEKALPYLVFFTQGLTGATKSVREFNDAIEANPWGKIFLDSVNPLSGINKMMDEYIFRIQRSADESSKMADGLKRDVLTWKAYAKGIEEATASLDSVLARRRLDMVANPSAMGVDDINAFTSSLSPSDAEAFMKRKFTNVGEMRADTEKLQSEVQSLNDLVKRRRSDMAKIDVTMPGELAKWKEMLDRVHGIEEQIQVKTQSLTLQKGLHRILDPLQEAFDKTDTSIKQMDASLQAAANLGGIQNMRKEVDMLSKAVRDLEADLRLAKIGIDDSSLIAASSNNTDIGRKALDLTEKKKRLRAAEANLSSAEAKLDKRGFFQKGADNIGDGLMFVDVDKERSRVAEAGGLTSQRELGFIEQKLAITRNAVGLTESEKGKIANELRNQMRGVFQKIHSEQASNAKKDSDAVEKGYRDAFGRIERHTADFLTRSEALYKADINARLADVDTVEKAVKESLNRGQIKHEEGARLIEQLETKRINLIQQRQRQEEEAARGVEVGQRRTLDIVLGALQRKLEKGEHVEHRIAEVMRQRLSTELALIESNKQKRIEATGNEKLAEEEAAQARFALMHREGQMIEEILSRRRGNVNALAAELERMQQQHDGSRLGGAASPLHSGDEDEAMKRLIKKKIFGFDDFGMTPSAWTAFASGNPEQPKTELDAMRDVIKQQTDAFAAGFQTFDGAVQEFARIIQASGMPRGAGGGTEPTWTVQEGRWFRGGHDTGLSARDPKSQPVDGASSGNKTENSFYINHERVTPSGRAQSLLGELQDEILRDRARFNDLNVLTR